jgi:hypothetical protein
VNFQSKICKKTSASAQRTHTKPLDFRKSVITLCTA